MLNNGGAVNYSINSQSKIINSGGETEDSEMKRLSMSLVRVVVVMAAVVLSCTFAGAAEQSSDTRVAETTVGSTTLSWQPNVSYKSAVLTVSGPGKVSLRRDFGPMLRAERRAAATGELVARSSRPLVSTNPAVF